MTRLLLLAFVLPACIIEDNSHGDDVGGTCTGNQPEAVDTGQDVSHEAGVDAGYYISYLGAGQWHIDWTCDTKLSALGCEFSGTIDAPGVTAATCYQCESNDVVNVVGSQIQFDTQTSTGLDGIDFTTPAGESVVFDLYINQIYQPDLVFLPHDGVETPTCLPISVVPTSP